MFQRTKVCSSLLLAFGSIAAHAQDTTPVQRVEVTGSSIKRVDAETALPVQTISRQQIDTLGITTTEQLLASISAVSAVGSTNTAEGAGLSTYGEATVSLRGLGDKRTLVLVNGRRLANYATDGTAVDINSIPLSAVDHVEILKDGASGVYGSDAIAGVVNFILRKDFKGVELSAYYGTPTTKGGGKDIKGSIVLGFGDYDADHFSLLTSLDVGHQTAIYGRQRSYANHGWDDGGAFDYPATGSGGLYTPQNAPQATTGVAPGTGLGNPLSPNNCAANGNRYDPIDGSCFFDSSPFVPLTPDVTRINGALNLRSKINDDNEFFIEGFLSNAKTVTTEQYSPYKFLFLATDGQFAAKGVDPDIIMNPTNPAYPLAYLQAYDTANGTTIAGQPIAVSYRAVDGGARVHTDNSTLYHLAGGFTGTLRGFDYDTTYSHNQSTVQETTQAGYQNQLALVTLLSGNDAFNPFVQNQTPALAAQIAGTNYAGPMISNSLSTDALDFKVSHDLLKLPGGMMTAALGATVRHEQLSQRPSAAYMSGDVSGYGGQVLPLDALRNSRSFFGEVYLPMAKALDADLSLRNDHYPNAVSTNPKFSMSFAPVSQVKLRGSYGTGFREPSLPELYDQQTVDTTAQFKNPFNGTVGQYPEVIGGNKDLKPEKSQQSSFGLVLEPAKNVSATIDYYHIRVSNEVTTLDPQFIADQASAGVAPYTGLVTVDGAGNITLIQSTNLNAGSVETSGIDVDLQWKSAKGSWGQFGAELNGTWIQSFKEVLPDGTVQQSVGHSIDGAGKPLNAVATSNGGILFRWRHSLQGTWAYGPVMLALTQNFQSGYDDAARADASDAAAAVHHGSFQTWDLAGAYSGVKNLTLRAGVKNIVNKQPPTAINLGQYFQTGYDPTYYDPHGRFVYGSVTYRY
jgi:iron complex outermembrane receptor protein